MSKHIILSNALTGEGYHYNVYIRHFKNPTPFMYIENRCLTMSRSSIHLALDFVSEQGFVRNSSAKPLSHSFALDRLSAIGLVLHLAIEC
jgi:hypothetical protein